MLMNIIAQNLSIDNSTVYYSWREPYWSWVLGKNLALYFFPTFGIVCSVQCHYDYVLSEDVKWTCRDNGRWSSYKTVQCTGRYMWYTYIYTWNHSQPAVKWNHLALVLTLFWANNKWTHYQAPILGVSTYNTCISVLCRYMYQQFANFKIFISLN